MLSDLTLLKMLNGRYHQATFNSFLKEESTQRDLAYSSYDQFVKIISKISRDPVKDNQQIFAQMLFNVIFNNTDDHLRNFSFSCDENGWCLSPVYDVVPSLILGQYHQSRLGFSDGLPLIDSATKHRKLFNLSKPTADNIVADIKDSISEINKVFKENGVTETDWRLVNKMFKC